MMNDMGRGQRLLRIVLPYPVQFYHLPSLLSWKLRLSDIPSRHKPILNQASGHTGISSRGGLYLLPRKRNGIGSVYQSKEERIMA